MKYKGCGIMNFGNALSQLKKGKRVFNENWNGREMYLEMQFPDETSGNSLPYIYMVFPGDHPVYPEGRVPWTPSQLDLLSEGWAVDVD
jgi:hypothetical protein